MSPSTQKAVYFYISEFLLLVLTISCYFGDIIGANNFKYSIFALSLVAIFFSYPTLKTQQFLQHLKIIVLPWVPWVLGTVILMFVHGTKDLTQYLNAVLLVILIFSSLYCFNLRRKTILLAFAFCLTAFDIAIVVYILKNGATTNIIGANRNELFAVLTFINVGLASHFLLSIDSGNHDRFECLFLGFTILFTLAVTVMSEVRNAILAYGSCAGVFLLFGNKNNRKYCLFFGLIFIVLIALSFATGRMQSGIQDIQQLEAGNSYTSWGLRIEMWKMVLRGFPLAPLFGWGSDAPNAMLSAGVTFPLDWEIAHFHNDFLIALATGGIVLAVAWSVSMVYLFSNSIKDLTRTCVLTSILSTGLVERNMFEQDMLFPFVIFWTLLCVTDQSLKAKFK